MLTSYRLKRSTFYYYASKFNLNYEWQYHPRDDNKNEKSLTNLARAKRNIKAILNMNLTSHSSFLTLTYADNVQDYKRFQLDFQHFIQRLKRKGITISYLAVKELQQRGAIHCHMIIFNEVPDIDFANYWKHGFVYLKSITDFDTTTANKVANYFSKYLVNMKKGQLIHKDKKMYFTSRDVQRPFNVSISSLQYNQLSKKAKYKLEDNISEKIFLPI